MKHKHSKIHWMTFSGKVRCVDCWSNDELSLCKSCGKMANHSSKDCPIVPTPSVECNCACHCHSGPCKSAHSHFCIHCQPNKKEGATLCDYEKTGRCLDTTHSGHWSQPKLGCKEDCQHIKDCPNATQKGVVPPQTDKCKICKRKEGHWLIDHSMQKDSNLGKSVTSPQTDKTTWEKRFDEKFYLFSPEYSIEFKSGNFTGSDDNAGRFGEKIKSFIAELLKEQLENL